MKLFEIKNNPECVYGKRVKVILPGHYNCSRGSRIEYSRKLVTEGTVFKVKTFGHTTFIDVKLDYPVTDTYYNETYSAYPVMVTSDVDMNSKIIFK